ncbi:hypothetical protein D9M71_365550 [compost metagenome]
MPDLLAIAIEREQALMGNVLRAGDPAVSRATACGHGKHERFIPERQEQLILTAQGFDPEPRIADTTVEQGQLHSGDSLNGQADKCLNLTGGDIRFYTQLQRQAVLPLAETSAQGLSLSYQALRLWV